MSGTSSLQIFQLLRCKLLFELIPPVLMSSLKFLNRSHNSLFDSLRGRMTHERGYESSHIVRKVVREQKDHTGRHPHCRHEYGVWLVHSSPIAVFVRLSFLFLSVKGKIIVNNQALQQSDWYCTWQQGCHCS